MKQISMEWRGTDYENNTDLALYELISPSVPVEVFQYVKNCFALLPNKTFIALNSTILETSLGNIRKIQTPGCLFKNSTSLSLLCNMFGTFTTVINYQSQLYLADESRINNTALQSPPFSSRISFDGGLD
jgi:hypothetical protein